eukprot:TRINITY_DN6635_c0_g1_i1.p1 TRINITY_DN6635_c0_g1~~TRINITY_DN6635_c0_g1_i1.p1  ORF type:complete len:326 (-),score=48.23 TRINITY_DN6635_c0_g1_i1:10-987(-)
MAEKPRSKLYVLLLIMLSIGTSIGVVMMNKYLVVSYKFDHVLLVTTCHFVISWILLDLLARWRIFTPKNLPWTERISVALIGTASIASMNLSLRVNSVGLYQMFKLLCIPSMVALERTFYGKIFTTRILFSLFVLVSGVALSTVTDIQLRPNGIAWGIVAVASTTVHQIWMNMKQRHHNLDQFQFLHSSLLLQAAFCGFIAMVEESYRMDGLSEAGTALLAQCTWPVTLFILGSCFLALGSNLCGTALVGQTSAVTYQVVGQAKMIGTLLFGMVLFGVNGTGTQALQNLGGVVLAVCGVIMYTGINLRAQQQSIGHVGVGREKKE